MCYYPLQPLSLHGRLLIVKVQIVDLEYFKFKLLKDPQLNPDYRLECPCNIAKPFHIVRSVMIK